MIGKIKSYGKIKGFGFIRAVGPDRENMVDDIFFNINQVLFFGNEIKEGLLVAFDLGKDRSGRRCAVRVRLPGDADVASPGHHVQEAAERVFRER